MTSLHPVRFLLYAPVAGNLLYAPVAGDWRNAETHLGISLGWV